MENELIYKKDTNNNSGIFILINGYIELFDDNLSRPIYSINEGDLFNELSIIYSNKRLSSAKAIKK